MNNENKIMHIPSNIKHGKYLVLYLKTGTVITFNKPEEVGNFFWGKPLEYYATYHLNQTKLPIEIGELAKEVQRVNDVLLLDSVFKLKVIMSNE